MRPQQRDLILRKKLNCLLANLSARSVFESFAIRECNRYHPYFLEHRLSEILLNCDAWPFADSCKNHDSLYVARDCGVECYTQTVFKILLPFMEEVLDCATVRVWHYFVTMNPRILSNRSPLCRCSTTARMN